MKHSSVSDDESALLADPRWELVQRIIGSPGLSRSARLSDLLTYVTRKALTDRSHEITEQQIGVNVFGRPADYNPAEDNIVRSHARLLRQRLEAFYAGQGSSETLHLTIPKGGYIPVFRDRADLQPGAAASNANSQMDSEIVNLVGPFHIDLPEAAPVDASPSASRSHWPAFAALGAAIAVAVLVWTAYRHTREVERAPVHSAHLLWSSMFQRNRPTLVVVADSALVMYENLTKHAVSLNDYLTRRYLSSEVVAGNSEFARVVNGLSARRYTSFVDLNLITRLNRLPEVVPDRLRIAYARDLGVDSFKQANVIISGAIEANPWLSLFENRMNFIMRDDLAYTFHITNKRPRPGELPVYSYNTQEATQNVYAIVAYLPAREGTGNALVIEGTTTAGTEAAADFVLDEGAMTPIVERASMPDGLLRGFEILLQTRNMAGSAPPATVVATHFTEMKQ